jgi:hypothetical protein
MAIVTEEWFQPKDKGRNASPEEKQELEELGFETEYYMCEDARLSSKCDNCGEILTIPFIYWDLMEKSLCLCNPCAKQMAHGLNLDVKNI